MGVISLQLQPLWNISLLLTGTFSKQLLTPGESIKREVHSTPLSERACEVECSSARFLSLIEWSWWFAAHMIKRVLKLLCGLLDIRLSREHSLQKWHLCLLTNLAWHI